MERVSFIIEIKSLSMPIHMDNNENIYLSVYFSGYGFVDFDSPAAAQKAVASLKANGVQAQMAKVRATMLLQDYLSCWVKFPRVSFAPVLLIAHTNVFFGPLAPAPYSSCDLSECLRAVSSVVASALILSLCPPPWRGLQDGERWSGREVGNAFTLTATWKSCLFFASELFSFGSFALE